MGERLTAEREADIRAVIKAAASVDYGVPHTMAARLLAELDAVRAERDEARMLLSVARSLAEDAGAESKEQRARAERAEAGLAALREEVSAVAASLRVSDEHYGYPVHDDPRLFTPDPEGSTDKERAAHARAVQEWDEGRGTILPAAWSVRDDGTVVHRHAEGWGLGTSRVSDDRTAEAAEALEAALADTAAAAGKCRECAGIVRAMAAEIRGGR